MILICPNFNDVVSAGIKSIGENRIQEAENKFQKNPKTLLKLNKRLVGHLQTNKINKALQFFDAIDSGTQLLSAVFVVYHCTGDCWVGCFLEEQREH